MSDPAIDTRTFRIGFLAALETDDGAYVAGLLVTTEAMIAPEVRSPR